MFETQPTKMRLIQNLIFLFFTQLFTVNSWTQTESFAYTGAVQTYTVPAGVSSIRIVVRGGSGGDGDGGVGGLGACMEGSFAVSPGDELDVIVGGQGLQYGNAGGGGGGSGVVFEGAPWIIAGGGGGAAINADGHDAVTTEDGVNSSGAGGVGGDGGEKGYVTGDCGWASGGGGFYGNGYGGDGTWDGGALPGTLGGDGAGDSWADGGAGGEDGSCTWTYPNLGAWGCGGGGAGNYGGAGGGGYSGGGGGQYVDADFTARGGGGGGSFNDGYDQVNTAGCHDGEGEIEITVLCTELELEPVADMVCEGEEIILDATSAGGGTITWDGGVVNGIGFIPPLGVTTYTAISDDEDDCELSIEIEVVSVPDLTLTADVDEICLGEAVTFTVEGVADVFVWDPVDVEAGVPYIPGVPGTETYTVEGSVGDCASEASIEITVHDLPAVTASVDETEICLGDEVVFTGAGADDYSWDFGVIDGVAFEPAIVGLTTYTVTGTDVLTGCANTASIDVTVYDIPDVAASASDTDICLGEEIVLTGSGAATYVWDGGVLDGVPFAPPSGVTVYNVTGTSADGCENMASIEITVTELPDVTASADLTEICTGDEIVLSGGGADSYTWDMGVEDGVAFEPVGIGVITYTVTGTAGDGCSGMASIDVLVHDLPSVVANAEPSSVCEGESITFSGAGAVTYVWDGGIVDGVPTPMLTAGDYIFSVVGTSADGCENSAEVEVVVHENPEVGAVALTTEVCFGESTTLNGTGAMSYAWDGGLTDGVSFTPEALGIFTYTVVGTNEFGCQGTASITINVIDCEPVVPGFELLSPACVGDCFEIKDLTTGGVVGWEWDFGGASDPNTSTDQNPTICVNSPGNFVISLTTTSHTGAVSTITEELTVFENPVVNAGTDTIIDLGGDAILSVFPDLDGDYIWSPSKFIECSDCPITTVTPEESETYLVEFYDENGCYGSDTVMVLVNFREGVGVPTAFSPNGDGVNDVLFVKGYALKSIYFAVYNRYGELLFKTTSQDIGWDGTHQNRPENPGVFTWVLQYEYLNGKKGSQKGNTTLVR